MDRRGRKPLASAHVDRLSGSERAKSRLRTILKTLSGEWTIEQACAELGISSSRFHTLRHNWLAESLALLEPRPVGRPPNQHAASSADPELEAVNAALERELQLARARLEVAEILTSSVPPVGGSKKKGARRRSLRQAGRSRRKRAR